MRDWPLFVGVLLTASGAVGALTLTTSSSSFAWLMHVLVAVGILCSFLAHVLGRSTTVLGFLVMVAGFMVLILRHDLGPWTDSLFPVDLQSLEETSVAALAAWFLAGFCFMQASRYNSVFVAATGMAILGLLATINVNWPFLVAFWAYTLGAVFTWGYEHLLQKADGAQQRPQGAVEWGLWSRWHLSASVLLLSVVLVVATVGGSLLHAVTPNIFGRMSGQIRQLPDLAQNLLLNTYHPEDFRVGTGPVRLPETEAFRVSADWPGLWRTQVYDSYVGSGWTNQHRIRQDMQRLGFLHYAAPTAVQYPGVLNEQVFTFPVPVRGYLPAVSAPLEVKLHGNIDLAPPLQPGGPPLQPLRMDNYGCVRLSRLWADYGQWGELNSESSRHYEVLSRMPLTDAADLRGRGSTYPEAMAEIYVNQVTLTAQAYLAELVDETVADLADPYDRVVALRDMLAERCLYSTEAPAIPRGKDAAVHFLLNSRQGACDLFATALAVTTRMAGVPARVAVGYQTGEYDSQLDAFIVKHSDGHAWTEVFFPGVGWVPFDVQAVRSYEKETLLSLVLNGYVWLALVQAARSLLPWLVLPIAAYVAISGVYDLRRRFALRMRRPPADAFDRLSREFRLLCRILAGRARISVTDATTPQEMVRASMRHLAGPPLLQQRLEQLTDEFYEARYAPMQSARKAERLRRDVREMRRQSRAFSRRSHQPGLHRP